MSNSEDDDLLAAWQVTREADARLHAYVDAVLEHGRHVNLTAAKTQPEAVSILLLPSVRVAAVLSIDDPPALAVDIGSGNGFPGVTVAALCPECRVVLVERRKKKARAIQACLDQAGIPNAEALACDAREIKNERPELMGAADLVTLRAVGPLDETTRLAAPLLAPGGRVVHWKKPDLAADERAAGESVARQLGLEVLPDVTDPRSDGILVVYRKPAA